jgi:hypothetical protein
MSNAGRSSFTKRQKEQTRMEKRREKDAKKKQRSLEKKSPGLGEPGVEDVEGSELSDAVSDAPDDVTPSHPAGEQTT